MVSTATGLPLTVSMIQPVQAHLSVVGLIIVIAFALWLAGFGKK